MQHGLQKLQGHDLPALKFDLVDAGHAHVLQHAQMVQIQIGRAHV